MAQRPRDAHLHFPLAGIDRAGSYRNQPPYTTDRAVSARATGTSEGRGRGGQRPGLIKAYETDLGGEVRMLAQVTHIEGTAADFRHSWHEGFDAALDTDVWTAATWLSATMPPVADAFGAVTENVPKCGAYSTTLQMDVEEDYWVGMYIMPYAGAHYGTYYMWFRLNDATPAPGTKGVEIVLNVSGSTGAYTGTVALDNGATSAFTGTTIGSCTGGWLKVFVDTTNSQVDIYWCGEAVKANFAIGAAIVDEETVGFGMDIGTDTDGVCIIDDFYVNGSPATGYTGTARTTSLIAIANEKVWKSSATLPGTMDDVSAFGGSGWTAAPDIHLNACERGGLLYIADSSVHNVQIFNPDDNTLNDMDAEGELVGTVPTGCNLICLYRDRITLAAYNQWNMSRSGDPLDWDTAETDPLAAVSGTNSDAGVVGDNIRALFPFSDDYLIFGCANSIWVLRGDAQAGGIIDNLSYEFGVIAGCHGPYGEIYLLANHGLAVLPPGPLVKPQRLSATLPRVFERLNPAASEISLAFDPEGWGLKINITPGQTWYFDLKHNSFWEDNYSSDHEAYSAITFKTDEYMEGGMLIGCKDGYIRRPSPKADTDDGTAISSYVDIGPYRPFSNPAAAIMMGLTPSLATGSGDIDWSLYAGNSEEEAVRAAEEGDSKASGTWSGEGLLATERPMVKGSSFVLRLSNGENKAWEFETIIARVRQILPIKL